MNEQSGAGPILRAQGLCRSYLEASQPRAVLSDVTLSILPRTLVAIMGPSGSGKSTLLHLLCGLDQPSSGSVELNGQDLFSLNEEGRTLLRRRYVGFVFQFFNLVPHLTVAENIALPLWMQGVRQWRKDPQFERVVEFFGLSQCLERRPHELSGGEMQRTSIARSLVHRPAIVLADEPTGNLSSKAGREVLQFLRRSVDELGQTVLLVTHNPRDAAFADTIHFLQDGQIEARSSLSGNEVHEDRIAARMEKLGL